VIISGGIPTSSIIFCTTSSISGGPQTRFRACKIKFMK
jgi:hypothetical protein